MKKLFFIYLFLLVKTAHSFANVGFYGPVLAPPDPTVTGTTTICVLNSTTLTASVPPPTTNIIYRWFNTGSALDLVPIFTGASYTTPALLTSRSYFVESYNTVTLQKSGRTQVNITVIIANADVPVGTPAKSVICSGDSTTIAASSIAGATTFRWYTALTGGTLLYTGSVYHTGPLTNPAIYYLESETCVGLFSARTPVLITVLTNNDIVTGTPANSTLCAGDSTSITGSSLMGNTIFKWYDVATGGTALFTGNPYRIGNLSSNAVYYVQTVSAGGCFSARFPVPLITSIPVLNPPTVSPAAAIICSGQSATFTANSVLGGSATYRWYDALTGGTLVHTGQTFNTGPVNNTGAANALITYYVEVQDATGCLSGRTPVLLTIRPAVAAGTVNPATTTICSGASVLLTGSTLLGSIAQYDWYDAATDGTLLHSGITYNTGAITNGGGTNLTQNYYLELVDTAGCKSLRAVAAVIVRPALSLPLVNPLTTTICSGDSVSFTASNALGTPGIYRWYDALTGGTLLHTGATYVTSALTNNGTVDLTRAFYVDFEDGSGCLSARAPGTVVIRPVVDVPVVNPAATTVCSDAPITFTASSALGGGVTYKWYDALSGGTLLFTGNPYTADPITNTGATNLTRVFYVALTDADGCVSARTPATAIVTPAVDAPLVNPPASQVCSGGSATFTASSLLGSGVTYKWYDAANAGTLLFTGNPFSTGAVANTGSSNLTQSYYAELTDANGCVSLRTPATLVITPAVDAALVNPPTTQVCSGGSATFTASSALGGGVSYKWYDASTAGTLLFTGNPFTTGPITNTGASNLTQTYYVEITDGNGCLGLRTPATVVITPSVDAPIVTPPTSQICSGGSATFTASSALGSGVTYKWYDDITAGTLLFTGNPFTTGPVLNGGTTNLSRTYYAELTDGDGCVSLRTPATLVISPTLDAATVTPPVAQTCSGGSVTFTANSVLGTGVSYNWYDAATGGVLVFTGNPFNTGPINNTGTGNLSKSFYVELADGNGCTSTRTPATVLITPVLDAPLVNPPVAQVCAGGSTTFTASSLLGSGVTYTWYDAATGGTLLFTGNPFTTGPIANTGTANLTQTYYVALADSNGCVSTRSPATVVVAPILDAPTVTPPIAQVCSGGSATFTASSALASGVTYRWYDAATAGTLLFTGNPYTAGPVSNTGLVNITRTYYVELEDSTGCLSAVRAPASLIVTPALDAATVTPPVSQVCSGGTATFTASSAVGTGAIYTWYDAAIGGNLVFTGNPYTTSPIANTGPTNLTRMYYVAVGDSNGCVSAVRTLATLIITPALDAATVAPAATQVCSGGSATFTASSALGTAATYNWYDAATAGTLLFTGNPFTTGPVSNAGGTNLSQNYYVSVTDSGGCVSAVRTPATLVVTPALAAATVTPPLTQICSGGSTTFTASSVLGSAVTYNWYDAATGGTLLFTGNPFTTGSITNNGGANLTRSYYVEMVDTAGCNSLRAAGTVIIRPSIDAAVVNPPVAQVCSGASVTFTASSALGTAVTYNWYDAATGGTLLFTGNPYTTGPIANNGATNASQSFYVELVDTAGCISLRTPATVIIRPSIDAATVNPPTAQICSGSSVTFTASSVLGTAVSYNWYDAATGGTLLFTGNPFNTGPVTNNGIADLSQSFYVELVDTAGCTSVRASGTVVIAPALAIPTITPPFAQVCSGGSVTFTASSILDTAATYNWYDAATGGTLLFTGNPFTTGPISNTGIADLTKNYYVELVDSAGCKSVRSSATVVIRPSIDAATVTPLVAQICSGDSASFTASSVLGTAVTYNWYDAATAGTLLFTGNPFNTGAISNTGLTTTSQMYYVELVDTAGCKSLRTPATLIIRPALDAATVNPPAATVCSGNNVTFTASSTLGAAATYKWYDAVTGGTLLFTGNPFNTGTVTNPGAVNLAQNFYVELVDTAGCTSARTPATVIITPALDAPLVNPPVSQVCSGDSVTFTASSALGTAITYHWYDAATGGAVLFTGNPYTTGPITNSGAANLSKNFYVELEDTAGCRSLRIPATVVIIPALDAATVTPPIAQVCSGESATFTANSVLGTSVTYNWYDAATGGTLLFTGNPYTTGPISNTGAANLTRTYYVELVDTAGCRSVRTPASIIVRPAIDAALVNPPTALICSGASTTFTASSVLGTAVSYNWYDAATGGTLLFTGNPYTTGPITNASATDLTQTYYVELEDTAGCISLRTPAVVTIRPATDVPLVNPALTQVCSGGSTSFTASSALGTATAYQWYDAATGGSLLFTGNPFTTGPITNTGIADLTRNYYVELIDTAGCTSIRTSATVIIRPAIDAALVSNPVSVICSGDSALLNASSVLGTAVTYNWYDAVTGGTLLFTGNPFNTGAIANTGASDLTRTYYVELVDTAGCKSLRTLATVIIRPAIDAATVLPPASSICSGDSVSLSATSVLGTAVTYNWYDAATGGTLLYTGNPFNTGAITNAGATDLTKTYYVELVDTAGCNSLRTPVAVIIRPSLDVPVVNPAASVICSGTTVTLTATSALGTAVTYNWYDAATAGTLLFTGNPYTTDTLVNNGAVDLTRTYYVELLDTGGCKSLRSPALITTRPSIDAAVVNPPTTVICSGNVALLTATSVLGTAISYNWYDAATAGTLLYTGNPYTTDTINNNGVADLTRTYYVELVDTGGCKSLRSPAIVAVRPALDAAVVNPPVSPICSGDSVSLTATSVLGTAVSYNWYDAATGGTLVYTGNPFNTGAISNTGTSDLTRTYYVALEDTAGCSSVRTPAVIVIRPALDVPVVNPALAQICSGNTLTFTASSVMGSAVSYNWYDAATAGILLYTGNPFTTDTITNTGAADLTRTYYVSLVDTGGCVSVRTPAVVVIRPAIDAALVNPPAAIICSGNPAVFTATSILATAVTYNWYDAISGGSLLYTGNPYSTDTIINTGATDLTRMYYVELVDTAGCKSLRTPATAIVRPALDAPLVNPPAAVICSGHTVTLTATSVLGTAVSYNWYDVVTGGTAMFSGNPYITDTLSNSSATDLTKTYYVELVDTGGCRSVRTPVAMVIRPALDVPLVNPPVSTICTAHAATLTATSVLGTAVSYNWYDAATAGSLLYTGNPFVTDTINNATATDLTRTYYVELVDTGGCKSVRTPAAVIVRPALDAALVTMPTTIICSGNPATLTATSVLGSAVTYNWYDAITGGTLLYSGNPYTTDTINNTGATDLTRTYYIELVDTGGCISTRTPAVLIIRPALDVPVVNPPASLICSGHTVTLTATSVLGTAVTYNWYDALTAGTLLYTGNPYTTDTLINSAATDLTRTYYVELVDTGGCKSVRTPAAIVIRPALDVPVVNPPASVICTGHSVTLTATSLLGTAVTYNWYDNINAGTLLYTGNPYVTDTINNSSTTDLTRTYYVELVDTGGCKSVRTPAAVIIRPALDVPIVVPPAAVTCSGNTVTLNATSVLGIAATYNWYDALTGGTLLYSGNPYTTDTINNTSATDLTRTYFVELVDTAGCVSVRTPVAVVIRPALDVPLVNPLASLICSGDSLTLTASSLLGTAVTYSWYDSISAGRLLYSGNPYPTGAIVNSNAIDLARTYYVELTDTGGCRSLRTPAVVVIRPALDVPIVDPLASVICAGDSLTLTASSLLGTAVQYNWYSDLLGDSIVYTGNPYRTGAINNTSALDLARTYFVELVDTGGCRSVRTPAAVVIRPALDVPLVNPLASLICSGDSLTLTASSLLGTAVQYNWYSDLLGDSILYTGNPYPTGPIVNSSALDLARTYFVELVDTMGCRSLRTPSAVVIRPALDVPLVDPLASLICSGDSLVLTATSLLGTATHYNWYSDLLGDSILYTGNPYPTGPIVNSSAVDLARTYFVELVDTNGCRSLRTPSAVVIRPALDVPLVNPLASVICSGDSLTLTASSLLGTATHYNWYDGLLSDSILYTGNPYHTGAINNTSAVDLARTYFVELVDTTGCRSIRVPSAVIIRPALDIPIVNPLLTTICSGDSVELHASSLLGTAVHFNWYDTLIAGNLLHQGDTFNTGGLYQPTIFYVELEDNSGCKSIRTPSVVVVNVNLDQPSLQADNSTICVGSTTQILASSLASTAYNWFLTPKGGQVIFTGSAYETPPLTDTANYYVEGVNTLGCKSIRTLITILTRADDSLGAPNPQVKSSSNKSITFVWDSVRLAKSYEISTDDGKTWSSPSSGPNGLTHVYVRSAKDKKQIMFQVRSVTDSICIDQSRATSRRLEASFNEVGDLEVFYNAFSPNGDGVNDNWMVTDGLEKFPDNNVMIFDRWGKEIYNQIGYDYQDPSRSFSGKDFDDGTYFYVLKIPSIKFEKSGYVMIIR